MVTYLIKRLFQMIPVVIGISVIVFFLLHMIPGDPAMVLLGQDASQSEIERLRNLMGLNEPLYVQLFTFLKNVATGDLGHSIFQNESVFSLIAKHLPATLELAVVAMLIALVIAIPLGILSAVKQFSWVDYISMFFAQLGVSIPVFWMGMLLIIGLSVNLNWFPSFGRGEPLTEALWTAITTGNIYDLVQSMRSLFLPALTLGVMSAALITRMVRSTMLEVLKEDYVRTAEAKGVSGFMVIVKHAFRNALIPVITIVGLQFGNLLGGAIVTETVFAWPGIGRLVITAISQRDFPVVQGSVFIIAFLFALTNLIVDILYAVVNPKIQQR
ncbi:ABC transporter permease [Brevibacillus centrosporus]|uniref:Peptide/nickel transport system permease protein n=1 Tax=Brevibacillus centrosporus TaxID=54910 RepID=A0A1I3QQI7_9BACL|nr:ABC transporter permease [Brevibacillus centrosporus]MEC2129464.1 ABC transporter permease [Brevibacillus centrosporus]MED4908889.1 ABC transporter permease [Brevibacillus centrosporus]RNB65537.1 ABC transporter permease [Brevibacillus centrosporus]SFJ35397.1 peptide/nickel transport system permease protein [Brevibacillus centrosporus]GED29815.1 peptide ABC transporter permease [Brevibacillus centrosporus]